MTTRQKEQPVQSDQYELTDNNGNTLTFGWKSVVFIGAKYDEGTKREETDE